MSTRSGPPDTREPGDGGRRRASGLDPATTMIKVSGGAQVEDPGGRTTALDLGQIATTALPQQRASGAPLPSPPRRGRPPAPPTTAVPAAVFRWAAPALALLAVALLPVAAATTDLTALDGWGLAKVLGPAAWAAVLAAVAACLFELWNPRRRVPMLATATGVLILCSVGLPSVVQPAARFSTAWLLAGFTDAIAGDGIPPTDVDARFYWPAFFAQWAFFRDAGGANDLDSVLRWFPPAVVAVWAIGVYALARSMLGGSRAPWVAAWLFIGLNWIEQDYYSPQATGIVLLLTVLTFALGPLATRRTDAAGVPTWPPPHPDAPRLPLWRRWLVSGLTAPNRPTLPPRQLLLIFFCMALCVIAVAPAHQLTPFAIIGQLVLLAVVGRFHGRGLVLVAVVALVVYFIIASRNLWMSQLSLIIGSDDDGGAVAANVTDRLAGDTGQQAVKLLRVAMPLLTYGLAVIGAWVYWKRRRDLVPIGLAVVPMAFAAAQSYGGELFLRIVLYGLPILAILGADALRRVARRARRTEMIMAVVMLALFPLLVLIRGGNDAYQLVTPQQVELSRQTIASTPQGYSIVPLSHLGPYGVEGIDTHSGGDNDPRCAQIASDVDYCVGRIYPDVLITFTSVENEGRYLYNKPPGWSLEVIQRLVASGQYLLTYQDGYDAVLRKNAPPEVSAGPDDQQAEGAGG